MNTWRYAIILLILLGACATARPGDLTHSGTGVIRPYVPTAADARVARVGDMLIGRVAGLEVRRSERGHAYRIRGPRRLMGSEEPLLVLDGSPMQITFLNSLNPRDILEVYVLRDTAFYGSRGANGVLVVTTKRPG